MKCHYCGAEVAGDSRYCLMCGTRQEPVLTPPEEETPVWRESAPEQKEPKPEQKETIPAEQEFPDIKPMMQPPKPAPVRQAPRPRSGSRLQLPTKRGLGKMIFLGILTLGIYPMVIWSRIVTELNIAASRYDGKRTMPYFGMVMLAPITLGIYPLVWMHKFCNRIGNALQQRKLDYRFGADTFWLWNVLGSLILVGPFVFVHKLMKAMNRLNEDFNRRG